MSRFNKDTVLITGAVGFLGQALVHQFLKDGALVAVASRRFEAAARFCDSLGVADAFPVELDICSAASRAKAMNEVRGRTGMPLRALIANASNRDAINPHPDGPSDGDFLRLMETDLLGHYRLAEMMAEKSTSDVSTNIVWISSIYSAAGVDESIYPEGMVGTPAHYACTKAAIESLVRNLACKWGPQGVRVNAVVCGGIRNPERQPPEFVKRYSARVPLQRMARVEEVARPTSFLASSEASYITGSCLVVDGGYLAW